MINIEAFFQIIDPEVFRILLFGYSAFHILAHLAKHMKKKYNDEQSEKNYNTIKFAAKIFPWTMLASFAFISQLTSF